MTKLSCVLFAATSSLQDIPIVTPHTLTVLRDAGVNPELISNLVNIQRVSSCVPSESTATSHQLADSYSPSVDSNSSNSSSGKSRSNSKAGSSASRTSGYASGMDVED